MRLIYLYGAKGIHKYPKNKFVLLAMLVCYKFRLSTLHILFGKSLRFDIKIINTY